MTKSWKPPDPTSSARSTRHATWTVSSPQVRGPGPAGAVTGSHASLMVSVTLETQMKCVCAVVSYRRSLQAAGRRRGLAVRAGASSSGQSVRHRQLCRRGCKLTRTGCSPPGGPQGLGGWQEGPWPSTQALASSLFSGLASLGPLCISVSKMLEFPRRPVDNWLMVIRADPDFTQV